MPADDVPARLPLIDPGNAEVRIVNQVAHLGFFGSLFDLTLTHSRTAFDAGGNAQFQPVISARLRFDLEMAKALVASLNAAIDAVTTPADVKPN